MRRKFSRRNRNLEKKSRRNFVVSVLGIILILVFLFKIGIPLLADISFSFGQLFSGNEENKKTETGTYLSSPTLDYIPQATNSARLTISGIAPEEKIVELYLNGRSYEEDKSDGNGEFSFLVSLTDGENLIKARAKDKNEVSDFSETYITVYKKTPPKLEIEKPENGATYTNNYIEVKGKTDPGNSVTVNGFWAIVEGEVFSYRLELNSGENEITIQAEDEAGNQSERIIKINYSP